MGEEVVARGTIGEAVGINGSIVISGSAATGATGGSADIFFFLVTPFLDF